MYIYRIQSSEKSRFNLWPHFFLVTLLHALQTFRPMLFDVILAGVFELERVLLDIFEDCVCILAGIRRKNQNVHNAVQSPRCFSFKTLAPNKKMSQMACN